MDPEAFLDLANQVTKLKMYPYFEAAHCAIVCMYIKEDLAAGSHLFSRKHPLACWLSCMLSIFAGTILCNFLLGEPVLSVFKSSNQLLLATGVWYLIFYSPFDLTYKLCKFLPVKLVLAALKEVYRCKKVHDGVLHAAKLYPNGYLIMIIAGTVKGNGGAFLKLLERLIRGLWTPSAIEFMQPSFPTKACIAAATLFILDKKTDLISAPHALVYFGIAVFFIYFKLSAVLLGIYDPFVPFENLFCAIFMGGVWDALGRAVSAGKGDHTPAKVDVAKNGKTESGKKKD
ncbi:trimeric intracellular cation channel type 1B.1-like [Limulus polyphemus]|uniref:Trimeric intracellular cation channel type 1B.1-like n=1 Tax=Limulus polyphemus TaxID=6850 RepID=A0ABM1BYP2_LIMPO|nr:trimeric intracellular cation channel type 1B.1-like [Limulus polyphemus]